MVLKKAAVQVFLLLIGMAMLVFGIWRNEAQTVFSKAIRLCISRLDSGRSNASNQHSSSKFF